MNKPHLLLIDGDPYAYKAAIRAEKTTAWANGIHTAHSDVKQAVETTAHEIEALAKSLDAEVLFCWSDPNTTYFRHELGSYKESRKESIRPLCVKEIKQGLADKFHSLWLPNIEADDVLGIMATCPDIHAEYVPIVVSIDKDLKTIPSLFLNPDKMQKPKEITKEEANLFFYSQAIAGDVTDGFTGAPGFGMGTARKLLEDRTRILMKPHTISRGPRKGTVEMRQEKVPEDDLWAIVVSCYESVGLTEEDALMNARMARILTSELWDKEKQEVILWEPNKYD